MFEANAIRRQTRSQLPEMIQGTLIVLLAIAYFWVLSVVYVDFVYEYAEYLGFKHLASSLKLAISLAIVLVAATRLPVSVGKPSDMMIWIVYVVMLVPTSIRKYERTSIR